MQHRQPRPPQHRPAQERIVVDNLCYAYNGVVALHDVSLRAYAGSICALVGMNGAGKSTLFKALMGFVRPSRGTIAINGVPLREALRQQAVAYVPQTESVDWNFPVSVANVVMMGRYGTMNLLRIPRRRDHQAVRESLERVELWPLRHRQIGQLSGGQRKRAFVARALAQEASTAEQTIDVMNTLFGKHPGARANHAKGVVAEGSDEDGVPRLPMRALRRAILAARSDDQVALRKLFGCVGKLVEVVGGIFDEDH